MRVVFIFLLVLVGCNEDYFEFDDSYGKLSSTHGRSDSNAKEKTSVEETDDDGIESSTPEEDTSDDSGMEGDSSTPVEDQNDKEKTFNDLFDRLFQDIPACVEKDCLELDFKDKLEFLFWEHTKYGDLDFGKYYVHLRRIMGAEVNSEDYQDLVGFEPYKNFVVDKLNGIAEDISAGKKSSLSNAKAPHIKGCFPWGSDNGVFLQLVEKKESDGVFRYECLKEPKTKFVKAEYRYPKEVVYFGLDEALFVSRLKLVVGLNLGQVNSFDDLLQELQKLKEIDDEWVTGFKKARRDLNVILDKIEKGNELADSDRDFLKSILSGLRDAIKVYEDSEKDWEELVEEYGRVVFKELNEVSLFNQPFYAPTADKKCWVNGEKVDCIRKRKIRNIGSGHICIDGDECKINIEEEAIKGAEWYEQDKWGGNTTAGGVYFVREDNEIRADILFGFRSDDSDSKSSGVSAKIGWLGKFDITESGCYSFDMYRENEGIEITSDVDELGKVFTDLLNKLVLLKWSQCGLKSTTRSQNYLL